MLEYYSSDAVIESEFIFVSYCHSNKAVVEDCTGFLLNNGVRLWYDKALLYGDEWRSDVENLLRHKNCCGAIFFCCPDAIISKNVSYERTIATSEQEKRGKKQYSIFFVKVSQKDASYMQLLKNSFDMMEYDDIDKSFPWDSLTSYVKMVGDDPKYGVSSDPDYKEELLRSISAKMPQVIDKTVIAREKMKDVTSGSADIIISFGKSKKGGKTAAIKWRFLRFEEEEAVFISEDILFEDTGGASLDASLNNGFAEESFTPQEVGMFSQPIRLLSKAEADELDDSVMIKDSQWWLSDISRGTLQMIVRNDGTIYKNGYNNRIIKKGVRPVIVMRLDDAKELIFNKTKNKKEKK